MPTGPEVVAGIDVATADVRATCVDAAGRVAATGSAPLAAPERTGDGDSTQDAGSWWPATVRALRAALAALPGGGDRVRAVAVAATSGTVVLADAAGEPVGPARLYDDRSGAELTAAAQAAGAERFAALGLQGTGVGAVGRLGRLVREPTAARAVRACHTGDLLGHRLTGGPVPADWNSALKSGYDPRREEWAVEALAAAGVDPAWLPPVFAPGTPVGTVGAAAAAETGLPRSCAVHLGTTDGCAGQLACGATRPGAYVGVLGTTYVLKGVSDRLVPDPAGALYSHRHPDGGWLPGGASNTGGEALAGWPRVRLATLDAAAAARGPAGAVAYPLRRAGERFPFAEPAARGFVAGEPADEAEAYRAALEGVAFLERLALDRVRDLGLDVAPPLTAAGGGNRSPVWLAIRASVLGRPLRVVDTGETGFGAALLAAAGTLHPDLAAAVAAMVPAGRTVDPVEAEVDALAASYARWCDALRTRGWLP